MMRGLHPATAERYRLARETGAAVDDDYSTTEFAMTVLTDAGKLVTFAAMRRNDPAGNLHRIAQYTGGYIPDRARELVDALTACAVCGQSKRTHRPHAGEKQ